MKLDIGGKEVIAAPLERVWESLHDPRALRFVIDMVGADRVMMGSDMPFPIGDAEPTKIVRSAGLSAAETARINGGLARSLFRL